MIGRIICAFLAINLGIAIFKEFDSETLRFKNLGLAIMYMLAFVGFVFVSVKGKKNAENSEK